MQSDKRKASKRKNVPTDNEESQKTNKNIEEPPYKERRSRKTIKKMSKTKEDIEQTTNKDEYEEETAAQSLEERLLRADMQRNGYPPLGETLLTDPLRGHWDLWPKDGAAHSQGRFVMPAEENLMARNPAGDIQIHVPVCIDFGTSSTVVALRENGRKRLLRIGISDWKETAKAKHFENPTAVEFINVTDFAQPWLNETWRPHVTWKDLKCSHQAKNDISSVAKPETLYSIIGDLKSWVRNVTTLPPLDMRDQRGTLFRLHAENDAPSATEEPLLLNPLEIYAFHLGLAINNQYRENGRIYHEYYMSFPVSFDTATRQRIISSFSKGLERSLPESLGIQEGWRDAAPFTVHEGADEPVAYAAAVLGESGLEPTDSGLAFGVFDFGGGTVDFAFGIYRWATEEEESRKGWESVIQLLDVAGDPDLGGENLLHALAFVVIQENAESVLAKDLTFVLPRTERWVPTGMERVFEDSLVARANTTRLMEALRSLWETPETFDSENEGIVRLNMQSPKEAGDMVVEFKADKEKLTAVLHDRILAGISTFFVTFQQAFKRNELQTVDMLHILLAGNACRSPLVKSCFEEYIQTLTQQQNFKSDHFCLHDILLPDDEKPEGVTLKTGVALGLLNTVPGESVGICPVSKLSNHDHIFRYSFGIFRRGKMEPILTRFSPPDEWLPMGFVREDLRLIAAYTDSPLAIEGKIRRGDTSCSEIVVDWSAEDAGHAIFARPAGPDVVEIALDVTKDEPQGRNNKKITLR